MRFPGTVGHRAFLFVAALFAAVAIPLAAQQPTVPAPVAPAVPAAAASAAPVAAPVAEPSATPVAAPTTVQAGPRVHDELRPVRSSFGESRATPVRQGGNSTITISTVVLVLCIVILVLLIR